MWYLDGRYVLGAAALRGSRTGSGRIAAGSLKFVVFWLILSHFLCSLQFFILLNKLFKITKHLLSEYPQLRTLTLRVTENNNKVRESLIV